MIRRKLKNIITTLVPFSPFTMNFVIILLQKG